MPQEEMGLNNGQNTQVQNAPIQNPSPTPENVAPGLDEELNNSLEKFFNMPVEDEVKPEEPKKSNEQPIEEVKKQEPKAKEEPKKTNKEEVSQGSEEVIEKAPKDQSAWTALKNKSKAAHKMIVDRDEEITRLKKSLAERSNVVAKETEATKSEIEELKKFRAMVDLQADPEFVTKYEKPIQDATSAIKAMLKDIDPTVTEEALNLINFSDSAYMDQILKFIDGKADRFKTRKIEGKIQEILSLNDKKQETLSEHKGKYKEYLENKKKEGFTRQSEEEGRVLKHIDNISNAKDPNNNPIYEFLYKRDPGEVTDEALRNKINIHNNMVEQMHKKLNHFISVKTPEERTEVAIAAVAAHYLDAKLKVALKKLAGVEAQLKKVSVITTENEDPKPRRQASNGNREVSTDEALSSFLNTR